MNQIVCQFSNREGQVELIWSSGGGFFRPYSVAGAQLAELRESTRSVRKALGEVVYAQNQAGDAPIPGEPAYAMAEAGFRLYNYLLPSEDETARKIRKWLEDLRKQDSLNNLEIVVEEQAADPLQFVSIPWNLVYDERPAKHKPAFTSGKGAERWRPFWSIRYNLTSGRRVEPLKRMPVWTEPRVIMVVDPDVHEHLEDVQKANLAAFLDETGLTVANSLEELEVALEEGYPRLLYWLGHANPEYLQLGQERIAPSDLRNLLRSFDDRERPEGMLAFLNCCQTAEAGQGGSFLDVLHSFGFTGAIATEQQTIDTFANTIGLSFLRGFLQEGKPIGELMHGLRLSMAPLGLLYGAHCPAEIRVKVEGESSATAQPAIQEVGRVGGVALQAPGRQRVGTAVASPLVLPDQPYRSLGYYDRADRALFTGRDIDIVRFAARLDRRDTRILILHGESGLGKSSFLRAGVIPYLEEHCAGYRFLRRADDSIAIIPVSTDPIGQIAQTLLDISERRLEYQTPVGEPIKINLRKVIEKTLGETPDFATLRSALAEDANFFPTLLKQMAAKLPHALVLIIDQGEELFTLARSPTEIAVRDHTLKMLQRLVDIQADVKLIISLRTEYIGRLLDHLRAGRRDHLLGVSDDLLRDFSLEAMIAAIERPTSEEPIAEGQPSPRQKYGFRFAEGVAARIANDGLDLRSEHQDSILPLIQVICTQLYERKKSQPGSDGVITMEDLESIRGVEGGLKSFAEDSLVRSLRLDPPDRLAFKSLYTRLYSRQVDGTLTTWLAPRDSLESSWAGSKPFAEVVEAAVAARILREDHLRVEGAEPRPYIRLGHDALAKVAAAWQAELDEERRLQQERAQVEMERKKRREQIRKLLVGITAAAALAVLFGATALWARHQQTLAVRSKTQAQESLQVACQGLDDLLTEVADVDLAEIPQMQSVRKLLLQKARDGYENLRLRSESERDPELQWVSARASARMGDILEMLGEDDQAEPSYREAIRLLTGLEEEKPGFLPFRRDLVRSYVGLANLQKKYDRLAEARSNLLAADALRQPLEATQDAVDRKLLAEIDYRTGVLLARETELRGSPPSASSAAGQASQAAYEKAIRTQEALFQESRNGVEQAAKLGRYLNNMGKLQLADHQWEPAAKTFLRVLETVPEDVRTPGSRWQRARALYNLGALPWTKAIETKEVVSKESGDAGIVRMLEAEKSFKDLTDDFPEIPQYQAELASVSSTVGWLKRDASSLSRIEHALAQSKQLVQQNPNRLDYRMLYSGVGRRLSDFLKKANPARAETLCREDIRQLEILANSSSPAPESVTAALGSDYKKLSEILSDKNELNEARGEIEKAIASYESLLKASPDSPKYRIRLYEFFVGLSRILMASNEIEGTARVADELQRVWPDQFETLKSRAYLLAWCYGASKEQVPEYGARAVNVLREAVAKNMIHNPKDLDAKIFLPLKEREDFRRLRDSLKPPVAG